MIKQQRLFPKLSILFLQRTFIKNSCRVLQKSVTSCALNNLYPWFSNFIKITTLHKKELYKRHSLSLRKGNKAEKWQLAHTFKWRFRFLSWIMFKARGNYGIFCSLWYRSDVDIIKKDKSGQRLKRLQGNYGKNSYYSSMRRHGQTLKKRACLPWGYTQLSKLVR